MLFLGENNENEVNKTSIGSQFSHSSTRVNQFPYFIASDYSQRSEVTFINSVSLPKITPLTR